MHPNNCWHLQTLVTRAWLIMFCPQVSLPLSSPVLLFPPLTAFNLGCLKNSTYERETNRQSFLESFLIQQKIFLDSSLIPQRKSWFHDMIWWSWKTWCFTSQSYPFTLLMDNGKPINHSFWFGPNWMVSNRLLINSASNISLKLHLKTHKITKTFSQKLSKYARKAWWVATG